MSQHVNVDDHEVFSRLRLALLKFAQAADLALSSADSEIAGTRSWLESEQRVYWESQLRKRAEAVAKARDAVRQKKLYKDFTGRERDAPEEEKALAKCTAAFEQAQQKIESVKRALPKLERASEIYRGGVARLANTLTNDIPRATALLERLTLSVEQYVEIQAPSPETAPVESTEPSMARAPAAPSTEPVPPAPPEPPKPEAPK